MSKYKKHEAYIAGLKKKGLSNFKIAEKLKEHSTDFSTPSLVTIERELRRRKINPENRKPAKVLLFDIETTPMQAYTWSLYPKAIGTNMLIHPWNILCWSAKWLWTEEIISMTQTPKEARNRDDKRITKGLWELFEEADIIVAHNLNKYDRKIAQTRFLFHELSPPSPYQTIDTLQHLRKQFKIPSNRLDYVLKGFLEREGKISTSFDLWARCLAGEQEALDEMSLYCDQDILCLEDIYLILLPWIKPHPNIGLHVGSSVPVCASCGGNELTYLATPYRTYVSEFESFRCNSCGSIGRIRKNNTPKDVKDRLTVSTPS